MHDTRAVGVLECFEDAVDVAHGVVDGYRTLGDHILEQVALDELHDDERHGTRGPVGVPLGVFAGVVDAHDRRVGHAGRGLRLKSEPGAEGVVVGELAIEDLDGDLTAQRQVIPAEDGGHAATTDVLVDAVASRKHAWFSSHVHSPGVPFPA